MILRRWSFPCGLPMSFFKDLTSFHGRQIANVTPCMTFIPSISIFQCDLLPTIGRRRAFETCIWSSKSGRVHLIVFLTRPYFSLTLIIYLSNHSFSISLFLSPFKLQPFPDLVSNQSSSVSLGKIMGKEGNQTENPPIQTETPPITKSKILKLESRARKVESLKTRNKKTLDTCRNLIKKVSFLCLDIEAFERNTKLLLEIGWTIYDPSNQTLLSKHVREVT